MKIELHDLIGKHSGCYLYLEAFSKVLSSGGLDTEICSSYKSEIGRKSYPNVYQGFIFLKLLKLLWAVWLFAKNVYKNKSKTLIIFSIYGNITDLPFLLISKFSSRMVLFDVHEVISTKKNTGLSRLLFKILYSCLRNVALVHSDKARQLLEEFDYRGEVLLIPHVSYLSDVTYRRENLGKDLKSLLPKKKKYFLFFGNILRSKGIDDLLTAMPFSESKDDRFSLIIAGRDSENCVKKWLKHSSSQNTKMILRYLNDDEMKFLFDISDLVILPYRDIYQSGVWEMAITCRRPVLASELSYFREMITQYPSFGTTVDTRNGVKFGEKLVELSFLDLQKGAFDPREVQGYLDKKINHALIEKLRAIAGLGD